jgi:hypothetical protein
MLFVWFYDRVLLSTCSSDSVIFIYMYYHVIVAIKDYWNLENVQQFV